jgi:hypothetical protein
MARRNGGSEEIPVNKIISVSGNYPFFSNDALIR